MAYQASLAFRALDLKSRRPPGASGTGSPYRRSEMVSGAAGTIQWPAGQNDPKLRSLVLGEALFKSALARELNRADRSNTTIGLLTVGPNDSGAADALSWKGVVDALTAAKRETDVIGWLKRDNLIGVVLPEIQAPYATLRTSLRDRFLGALVNGSGADVCRGLSVQLYVCPETDLHTEDGATTEQTFNSRFIAPKQHSAGYDALKRGLDIVSSLALLILLSPLMLVAAALVKLTSSGPVFFKQVRLGHRMKSFTMFKFRTMRVNSNSAIHQEFVSSFIKGSEQTDKAGRPGFFKIASDPRITPIGRILRKTSIDELPQLLNVLRGEMSLVGPRPPLPYEVEQYQRWHCRRVHEAKPGITGLWQVMGRSRTTFDEMVRLDIRYAKTRGLWTDVKILLATPKAVIAGKGAC